MNSQENNINFWSGSNPEKLVNKYGSPLYVYNEDMLRARCREVKNLMPYPWFSVNYSIKANSNLELLKIVRSEGLNGDAMSPGEIYLLRKAGFLPHQILYIGNNVSADEMRYAVDNGITVSVDSLSQLETLGKIDEGGKVCVRFNPGIGAGHHEKVVTAGSRTKFGIENSMIEEVKRIAKRYSLKVTGINQHIGSLFLDTKPYIEGVKALLKIASEFDGLEFVDLGGGFGIPYKNMQGEGRLDMAGLSEQLKTTLLDWMEDYGREVNIKVEPGRYLVAESGVLLGRVHSVKNNYGTKYIGTDIGFNVLMRPVLYNSYHEITLFRDGMPVYSDDKEKVTVVGNICETGDILAKDRSLPPVKEGDIIAVSDAGAYGYSMCSNYNLRLRPAEVLLESDGGERLIRRRETLEDLLVGYDI
jgi:diaminopimelate decarboxylase